MEKKKINKWQEKKKKKKKNKKRKKKKKKNKMKVNTSWFSEFFLKIPTQTPGQKKISDFLIYVSLQPFAIFKFANYEFCQNQKSVYFYATKIYTYIYFLVYKHI